MRWQCKRNYRRNYSNANKELDNVCCNVGCEESKHWFSNNDPHVIKRVKIFLKLFNHDRQNIYSKNCNNGTDFVVFLFSSTASFGNSQAYFFFISYVTSKTKYYVTYKTKYIIESLKHWLLLWLDSY